MKETEKNHIFLFIIKYFKDPVKIDERFTHIYDR